MHENIKVPLDSEIAESVERFRQTYPPFVPFRVSDKEWSRFTRLYQAFLCTQNGEDFDHIAFDPENNKTKDRVTHLPKGSKVLILGAGTGREVQACQLAGLDPLGITLGSRNVAFGEQVLGIQSGLLREGLIEGLAFPIETFDCVIGAHVVEHALSPPIFLLNVYMMLKDGGEIHLEWPPPQTSDGAGWNGCANPHHIICYTPGHIRDLLLKTGFVDIKLFYESAGHPVVPESRVWDGIHPAFLGASARKLLAQAPEHIKRIMKRLADEDTRLSNDTK